MAMFALITVVTATLLSYAVGASAQQIDPIKNMCTRFDHQSIVKKNTLYIDGGKQTFIDLNTKGKQVGNITVGYNEYLLAIDLSQSWDWKTNISEKVVVKGKNPKTGTAPPLVSRGALYQGADDDDNFYLWGGTTSFTNTSFPGWVPPSPATYSLWSYNINSTQWDQFDVRDKVPYRPSSASSAEAPDQGLAFYFNGEIDSGSSQQTQDLGNDDKLFLEGMVVIDTRNHTARNLSTSAVSGNLPRSRGRMQYVPGIGEKGILVQIGGNQKPVDEIQNTYVGDLVPMNQIDIFDIASMYNSKTPNGTWYKQTASADVPAGRLDSCLVLASAPDNSSHNIYMYGGRGDNGKYFDDMYVLSLPSFTWTKLYSGFSPRFAHTCHRVGSRTLLTVGGIVDLNFTEGCDWEYRGVGVLDLSTVTWGSVYNATSEPYEVPTMVVKTIGGTTKGNATKRKPTTGFSSPALAALFTLFYPLPPPPPRRPSIATIAGAAGAGSAVVLGLLGTSLYLMRRRIVRFFAGDDANHPLEIGEGELVIGEIMGHEVFCELEAGESRRGSGGRVMAPGGGGGREPWRAAELEGTKDCKGDRGGGVENRVECVAELGGGGEERAEKWVAELQGMSRGEVVVPPVGKGGGGDRA